MSFVTSPGVVGFTNLQNTTAPNNVVPVSYFLGLGSPANIDVAFGPKALGSLLAQVPDATAAGGNKRGQRAVDFQMARNAATEVASGSGAVIAGGSANKASGQNGSIGGGFDNYLTGTYSACPGGRSASDRGMSGVMVFQPNSLNARGDTTMFLTVQSMVTTGAAASLLNTIGGIDVNTNQADRSFVLSPQSVMTFDIDLIATGNGSGDYATWKITGSAQQGANAAATTIIASTVTAQGNSAGFAALVGGVSIAADVGVGAWAIQVVGIAATPIKWQAFVKSQYSHY